MKQAGRDPRVPGFRTLAFLLLLTALSIAVQGYHFAVDDGAIYIPAVEHVASPELFPYGQIFFLRHARMSIFSPVVGGTMRLLHVGVEPCALGFHALGIFLLLLAGWWIALLCFRSARARLGAVVMLASVLPTAVSGTALPIMDSYLTARSLSTPLTLLAFAAFFDRRRWLSGGLIVLTALVHPQMAVYGAALLVLIWLMRRMRARRVRMSAGVREQGAAAAAMTVLPHLLSTFPWGPAAGPYREALLSRTFFFAWAWTWYEWVGIVAPLFLLLALSRLRRPFLTPLVAELCRALVVFGALSTATFLLLSSTANFDSFVRLQPMRSFHLIYIFMFLLLGGLAGELLLKEKMWRWLLLFVPICFGMYLVDRHLYPASDHLELPGRSSRNEWVQAFRWARGSTPVDAVFALPPQYLLTEGEDRHGFRAIAERSMTADSVKDSGVVSVFPRAAGEWWSERQMTLGWEGWSRDDFEGLRGRTPVTWVVVELRQASGLECPYRNTSVAVCRLRGSAGLSE